MRKIIKRLGVIGLLVSVFVGCAQSNEEIVQEQTNTSKIQEVQQEKAHEVQDLLGFENKANEVIVLEDSVQFVDGLGAEKTLDKNPERVVSLYTSHTSLWYEAGGNVIGRIQTTTSDYQLPEEALSEDIAIVATSSSAKNISIESVIQESPDLVILGTAMSQPTLVELFEVAGIETIVVDYENVEDYLKWFKVFAHLNGKPELYDEVAKRTLEEILQTLDTIKDVEDVPRVLNIYAGKSSLTANLSTSTVGGMIEAMGATNVADEWNNPESATRLDINMEAVLAANPDKILVQQSLGGEVAKEMIESTYGNNAAWQALDAVKNGEVYYLDMNLFHYKPNSRYDEAYKVLGEIFYPELF